MMKLVINGEEKKIKFGYNCFCDTDLMDRVNDLTRLFQKESVGDAAANEAEGVIDAAAADEAVSNLGKIKELFCVVRDLIFVGFKKYNPVETVQEVGDLLDDYMDEETEEKRGLFVLFAQLSDELFSAGFLSDLMTGETAEGMENGAKAPTDHKKPQKAMK